jgi:6-phosphogluconolactonase (cycloisomerase 2 family)
MSQKKRAPLFEVLEDRRLMSAGHFVYVESNNPNPGQNAILAYSENTKTGALSLLPHGRYLTGGTGYRNAGPALGPDDSDKEIIVTPDHRFLFAVNQGSDTIAEFDINSDGSLSLLDSAPFSSGGVEPVSLSLTSRALYVVNRGNSAEGTPGTVAPNVTAFSIAKDGTATQLKNSTVTLPINLSPAQILTTADGRFTFVDNFATPSNLKVSLANTIESYYDSNNNVLTAVPGGTAGLPANPPLLLGLVEDPKHHLIYAGLPTPVSGGIATFRYDDATGKVTYVGSVPSQGSATCWLNISPDGKYLYGADSASDAISVYSLANPLKPTLIQEFKLNGPSIRPGDTTHTTPTSQDFQFSFDSTGKYIYIVNHTTDDSFQQGNQLHTLEVGSDGKLSEAESSPIFFSSTWVPATAHVQGIAVT